MTRATALLIVAMLASPAAAQQPPAESGADKPAARDTIDPAKLGISLDRIRRELRQAQESEQQGDDPLRLRFTVEVFGKAPEIDLLGDFPLVGPVPYGAPTHQEVLEFLTPKEFRSPALPISAITYWAAQQLMNRSRRQRCEEELEEYKRLVMQGVNIAAPRCTQ